MECEIYLRNRSEGVELHVHIQPRASKTEIVGPHGDALKIRVGASPVEGQANRELCRFLARQLGTVQQQVQIISGVHSRQKRVIIKGKVLQEIREVLLRIMTPKPLSF